MPGFINLTGQRFGRLTVVSRGKNAPISSRVRWNCVCDCGGLCLVAALNLRLGKQYSCGCARDESAKLRFTKHGHTRGKNASPEYRVWQSMISRCCNPKSNIYRHYGGRGIYVCDRWKNSFEAFLEDMGPRPSLEYSIERIEVNGNYEKANCKWAEDVEQARNTRTQRNNTSGERGINWHKQHGKWNVRIGDGTGKRKHIGLYDSLEQAIAARKEAEVKYWGRKPS